MGLALGIVLEAKQRQPVIIKHVKSKESSSITTNSNIRKNVLNRSQITQFIVGVFPKSSLTTEEV